MRRKIGSTLVLVVLGIAGGLWSGYRADAQVGATGCCAVRLYSVSTNEMNDGTIPNTARIPAEWRPVGGGHAAALRRASKLPILSDSLLAPK